MTGEKALFVQPGFTRRIIGLQDEESEALLKLLFTVSAATSCREREKWYADNAPASAYRSLC